MPRRGENIYKRKDGRWEGRYIKSRDISGKAKYGYVYSDTYKTVKEKLKTANEFIRCSNEKSDLYFADLFEKWLQFKKTTVKESTFSKYRRIVNFYLLPQFSNMRINTLTTEKTEEFIQYLLNSGKSNGAGGLSSKTVGDIIVVLKSAIEYGKDDGYLINCNTKKLTVKKKDRKMRVLSASEQALLTEFLRTDTDLYKFGILISLYTGIRIGELCALQWKNIDIEAGVIKICKTLQRIETEGEHKKTKVIIGEPKSTCSVREIPIPNCLKPYLLKFKASPESFVLTGNENKFAEPRTMQYHFQKYIKELGISPVNYHALRHSFATKCVEMGFEIKSLSEILGHSSVNITLNKYVHSSFELKAANMNKLNF